ncbi:hypothetical protein [Spirosoma linguale]|uniref:Uncharacterized protein n=1 Tax=Spirosoma linguale (strain ATCC 33905 / DSM 74 / LMG 10896 / Claus 1) TaxID=504472 RepID=D2QJR5_SPILD|nr:hypothetical protein Slin_4124 [Spirosoma linguale DSM 74]
MLSHLKTLLQKEDLTVLLNKASEATPFDILLVDLPAEDTEAGFRLEISETPQTEELSLVQFFVGMGAYESIDSRIEAELLQAIGLINSKIPLVGFVYNPKLKWLFFRNVLLLSTTEIRDYQLKETVWMISYLVSLFAKTLSVIGSGTESAEEALAKHEYGKVML